MSVTYVVADVRDALEAIGDGTVDLVLTSPPFLALRSYLPSDHPDKHREIGSEPTPAAFLDTMLGLTAEWRRVLAPHGTLAVELGDTYAGGGQGPDPGKHPGKSEVVTIAATKGKGWPLAKSLSLIPEAYRLALAYGHNPLTGSESPAGRWRVRNVVDWCRPNPPVGALGDKFRPSTSDLVIACTSDRRWFDLDAVRTPVLHPEASERNAARGGPTFGLKGPNMDRADLGAGNFAAHPAGAPPLDHWIIPPGGYRGSHYAVFPPELCRIPIEAMCPRRVCRSCGVPSRRVVDSRRDQPDKSAPWVNAGQDRGHRHAGAWAASGATVATAHTTTAWTTCGCPGTDGLRLDGWHRGPGWRPGVVLDPFGGSGTTGYVASGLSRDAILIDIDDRNLHLARERLGMLLTESSLTELAAAS